MPTPLRPVVDPNGSLTDVAGVAVGHHHRIARGWRTGTTAVIVAAGATAGVDVRGGGPGTRETDLLRPENLIQQVHGICLTGGSAYGLAAASGVMAELERRGIGYPVGTTAGAIVPIVPAAVIFDLGRGGHFANRPDHDFGARAARAARTRPEANGSVGAGAGAVAGGLQGGVGSASVRLASGIVVAALAVVNAAGSLIDPASALPWESGAHHLRRPASADAALLREATAPPMPATATTGTTLNTTIGVVATTARLSKAECTKVASVSHDGMARAIRPVHSMFDGDTVFALATGIDELPDAASTGFRTDGTRPAVLNTILDAAALCFAAACTQAIIAATSIGGPLAYRDLCPSAYP
ncbi:MAG: Hydrolase [Ilumatobacteraceae bacterium]|nr:Hydrolase [Ilumatobacteraceae bacterium]